MTNPHHLPPLRTARRRSSARWGSEVGPCLPPSCVINLFFLHNKHIGYYVVQYKSWPTTYYYSLVVLHSTTRGCCCCCCLIGLRDPAVKIKSRNLFTDGPMGQIDREVVTREARVPSEVLLRTSIKSLNPSPYCDVISSPNLWSVLIGLSCIETDARHAGRHLPARIDSCQHFITNFVHIK